MGALKSNTTPHNIDILIIQIKHYITPDTNLTELRIPIYCGERLMMTQVKKRTDNKNKKINNCYNKGKPRLKWTKETYDNRINQNGR